MAKRGLNVFILAEHPAEAAIYASDIHVSRMIIETAQILSSVVRHSAPIKILYPEMHADILEFEIQRNGVYRKVKSIYSESVLDTMTLVTAGRILGEDLNTELYRCMPFHPYIEWARRSTSNYCWLYRYFDMLSAEYHRRFNKNHKSFLKLKKLLDPLNPAIRERLFNNYQVEVPPPVLSPQRLVELYKKACLLRGIPTTRLLPGSDDGESSTRPQLVSIRIRDLHVDFTWEEIVEGYRSYYCIDKAHLCSWTNRDIPHWFLKFHSEKKIIEKTKTVKGFKMRTLRLEGL